MRARRHASIERVDASHGARADGANQRVWVRRTVGELGKPQVDTSSRALQVRVLARHVEGD
eukprot:CAMPEP_0115886202 /NCGR_PEP_ID=MMETSP0287-20121206/31081_1 /TAXON_ID=412157 /ORGANISM="Chrysochromulina rotalis, Strain UIO044" /LENGTH=60 /DNA_ID=CAMNT_0003342669 /DNA_START=82 /DNA_END=264 /DNA_ORIENTATION=-